MKKVYTERSRSGFTLLEIMVVIGILSIVGVIILTIFTRTLRGNNKAQIIVAIKQNGQAVLENMSISIRNSDDILCPPSVTSDTSNTIVVEKNGLYTRYRIVLDTDNNAPSFCKPNGCIITDSPVREPDPAQPDNLESWEDFKNDSCSVDDPMLSAQILTDTKPQTGVTVVDGSFKSDSPDGFKDSIKINFVLGSGPLAPSSVAGQIEDVRFETSVQLR